MRFQAFAEWASNQIGYDQPGFHLDKDILVRWNKVYGPDTCCFVPKEINQLLIANRRNRSSLPIGVHFYSKDSIYSAQVSVKGRNQLIGRYRTTDEAFDAYKERKEQIIREAADKFKHQIDPRVYAALYSYKINITD